MSKIIGNPITLGVGGDPITGTFSAPANTWSAVTVTLEKSCKHFVFFIQSGKVTNAQYDDDYLILFGGNIMYRAYATDEVVGSAIRGQYTSGGTTYNNGFTILVDPSEVGLPQLVVVNGDTVTITPGGVPFAPGAKYRYFAW